jgi:solute carrier family 25 protein 33/36
VAAERIQSTIHWVLYEQMKRHLKKRSEGLFSDDKEKSMLAQVVDVGGRIGVGRSSKLCAIFVTYPHEVGYPN